MTDTIRLKYLRVALEVELGSELTIDTLGNWWGWRSRDSL